MSGDPDIEITPPDPGQVAVSYNVLDRERVRSIFKTMDIEVVPLNCKLTHAVCDIELNTDDIATLQSGESILLNGGPFGIYVRLVKTPIDYLNENPLPHQQGTNP